MVLENRIKKYWVETLGVFSFIIGLSLYLFYANNPLVYDDIEQILLNKKLHHLENLKDVIFCDLRQIRLFQNLTFAIDWAISGIRPWSSRIQNIIWSLLDIYLFIKIMNFIKPLARKENCILFAMLFTLPIQIQSIHYAMGRTTLIQGFFYLLLMYFHLKNKNKIIISLGIILSTLCKETCVLIPFLFLAYDLIILNIKIKEIDWNKYYLYFLSSMFIIIAYNYLKDPSAIMYRNVVGLSLYPFYEYLITQFYYFIFYIFVYFSPSYQSIIHEYQKFSPQIHLLGYLGLILLISMAIYSWKKRKTNPQISFVILLFLVSWIPLNTFLQMINPFAEYRYFICNLCLGYGLFWFTKVLIEKLKISRVLISLCIILYFLYNLMFLNNILSLYSRHLALYGYALELYPDSPRINLVIAEFYTVMKNKIKTITGNETLVEKYKFLDGKNDHIKNQEENYYQKAYKLYHDNPKPITLMYDYKIINFYHSNSQFQKAVEYASQVRVINKSEYPYINDYYILYMESLMHLGDSQKAEMIKDDLNSYLKWYNANLN